MHNLTETSREDFQPMEECEKSRLRSFITSAVKPRLHVRCFACTGDAIF